MHLRAFIAAVESFGTEGGAGFSTRKVRLKNGRERRNADWADPEDLFSLTFRNLQQWQYDSIDEMHKVCRGGLHTFLYRDRLNFRATNTVFAVATPGQTDFQLGRYYEADGVEYIRPVFALYQPDPANKKLAVQSTPTITADNSPITPVSIDHERGKVVTAPMTGGEVLRWTGFYCDWVGFNQDRLPFSIDNSSGTGNRFIVNGTVELIQRAPPELVGSPA